MIYYAAFIYSSVLLFYIIYINIINLFSIFTGFILVLLNVIFFLINSLQCVIFVFVKYARMIIAAARYHVVLLLHEFCVLGNAFNRVHKLFIPLMYKIRKR